ncbi:transmembrane protease serine 9-like [Ischnura elegans]|uniref:transmembrane protease serine 9-like n=1 Tax=Ischnura elegans TaxID=197161 RepID=UPI001ED86EE0|nr:transmembrane protease serine 9-like [Ischnura elegans]
MARYHLIISIFILWCEVQTFSQALSGRKCRDASGVQGVCRPFHLCPLGPGIPRGRLISRMCGIHRSGPPLICCPRRKITTEPTTTSTTTASASPEPIVKPGEKARHWCKKYSAVAPKIVHIIGGEMAKAEEFPHMAAIGFGKQEEPSWRCGGSLISRNFVLTAAHCLKSYPMGSARWVRLGTNEIENSVRGQTHPVIRSIPHPDYNVTSKYHDIALLEIGPALEPHPYPTVSKRIHPICLPSQQTMKRAEKAIATGWGQTEPFGDPSPVLLKVNLNIMNGSHCNETYQHLIKPNSSLKRGVDSTMICAGMLCGGKDTCKGDSGGPLQVRIRHSTMYEILGITSFGDRCYASSGRIGICTPVRQCRTAMDSIRRGGRPATCGFNGRDPIVCCDEAESATTLSTTIAPTTEAAISVGDKARDHCYTYSTACGSSLVGGSKVEPKEFPHMAALGFGPRDKISWLCGGSLISENFVLTAAHCLSGHKYGQVNWVLLASEVTRSFGEDVPDGSRRGQTHPVIRRIRHPLYKLPAKYNDIALLEIGPALEADALPLDSKELHPACLPLDFLESDPIYVATGWGRVGHGEDPSPDLLKVELDLLDNSICNQTFDVEIRTTNQLRKGIDGTMICAGTVEGGKDTCKGDSGGPLQAPFKEACMYEIWGITSFGKICGVGTSSAVYTRVSEFIPWIESIVWP